MNTLYSQTLLLVFLCCFGAGYLQAADEITTFMSLWDYDEPAATEAKFRDLLNDAKKSENEEYHPALLSQIARTYSLRREFPASHELLNDAEALLQAKMPVAETMVLLERGRAYNSDSDALGALPFFRRAFALADQAQLDSLAVDAAHMIAISETNVRSTRWNLIAMAIAETSEDATAQRWLGSLYNNLGWSYFDEKDFSKALALFEKGVAHRLKREQIQEWQIARWTVARTYRALGRFDEAMSIQLELLTAVDEDTDQLGYIHEELGELLLVSDGRENNAANHFKQAYKVLSGDAWLQANEPDRLARLKHQGEAG